MKPKTFKTLQEASDAAKPGEAPVKVGNVWHIHVDFSSDKTVFSDQRCLKENDTWGAALCIQKERVRRKEELREKQLLEEAL